MQDLGRNHIRTLAMLPWPDRFEDFHDKIGISLEEFRDHLTNGWLFNYVDALQRAGVRPILYYFSAHVVDKQRFTHRGTGAQVCVFPSPRLHCKIRGARYRYWPESQPLKIVEAYLATPLRALTRELRVDGCEAILCQEYEYTRFDVAVALGRMLHFPVFATFQGGQPPKSNVERLLRRHSLRNAAGLIIPAKTESQRVRAKYKVPPPRIAEIPNPINLTRWRPLPRAAVRMELGIPLDSRVVVWHGRIEIDKKGLDVLFDAWRHVARTHADHKPLLLLVGGGQDAVGLRRLVDAAPAGTVRWIDSFITDTELLLRYLATADVATLPSRREGFAVAVVEAMACGLPVVAADAEGVIEAIGSGSEGAGLLVPKEDPRALADALGRLIKDSRLASKLGEHGRRRAEECFSLDVIGGKLRDFLFGPSPRTQ